MNTDLRNVTKQMVSQCLTPMGAMKLMVAEVEKTIEQNDDYVCLPNECMGDWLSDNALDFGYIHEHYVDEDERWVSADEHGELLEKFEKLGQKYVDVDEHKKLTEYAANLLVKYERMEERMEGQLKEIITEGMGQKNFEAWLMNPENRRGEFFQNLQKETDLQNGNLLALREADVVELQKANDDKKARIAYVEGKLAINSDLFKDVKKERDNLRKNEDVREKLILDLRNEIGHWQDQVEHPAPDPADPVTGMW
jgi:hypothetical protein